VKQSLQFRLGQQLTMTPQLQQAVRLLQLSTLELNTEIQQALDSNLMLEVDEPAENAAADENEQKPGSEQPQDAAMLKDTIPDDLPVDAEWSSIYDSAPVRNSLPADEDYDIMATTAASTSLRDHLVWQTCLASFDEQGQAIAEALIDGINDKGYFTGDVADVAAGFESEAIDTDRVLDILHTIQTFEPAGVGARDLQECLLIQLRQMPPGTPMLRKAMLIVRDWFEALASRNLSLLKVRSGLAGEELSQALELIRQCSPNPGDNFASGDNQYVTPDVTVRRVKDRWIVEANPDTMPKLRINSYYSSLIKRGDQSQDNQMMRDHLQEARWLLKSLHSRQETLLRVAHRIIEHQKAFLEHGPEAMKPLVMREIAEELDLHESTISRAATNKYMLTPQGVFEFKYFFSSHVGSSDGDNHSSTAIRARIRKMIQDEQTNKPLSDNKITALLKEEGISVARRTVAKYRESMSIPSSSERKRMI
jgi:RNA polymerase sigma-54 factor